jgi:DNA mismatch repair ATPase MutS
LYHFTELLENDNIAFDYKLRPGNLTTWNAIRIPKLNAYPAEIIREARSLSKKMTRAVEKGLNLFCLARAQQLNSRRPHFAVLILNRKLVPLPAPASVQRPARKQALQ